uniref:Uncharacterized protein n=1 Tax=Anopheles atroparvus TaxID=41427 RepID=A0AAG5D2B7_ANOAO
MFLNLSKVQIVVLLVFRFGLICRTSPVLVLIANGSDITINFPGENNNNHVFSIVSASGNNNPSMIDWIGGNGANKAPTIALGQASGIDTPMRSDSSLEDEPPNVYTPFRPHSITEFDETDGRLPEHVTITEPISSNSTNTPTILTKTSHSS